MSTFGTLIREHRKALKLTQVQLAERVGKSQVAVSEWERDVALPSDLSVLAEALNMSDKDLALALAAAKLSDDPVEQTIRKEVRLSHEVREALIMIYRGLLPRPGGVPSK